MKVTILKEEIKKGLNIVERLTGKNLALPILNNVLMSAEKNFISFSTTNLEIGIKCWKLCKIDQEGKITVPVKVILPLVSSLSDEKIFLKTKNDTLYIEGSSYKTQIKGLNAEEFPIIPKIETSDSLELNNSPLCQGISQVINFCSLSQTRPEISGVYFSFQKEKLSLVATDSFRLAEKVLLFEKKDIEKKYSFILPKEGAQEVINVFSGEEEKVKICFSPNQIQFESSAKDESSPKSQLISRLIEGEYPNYQEIIPKKFETRAILDRNKFLNQVKIASIFSGKTYEVKLRVDAKEKGVEIFSQNPEIGQESSLVEAQIEGKDIEASFNYRFLVEGISQIKSSEIIFEFNGSEGPAVLKGVGDDTFFYVVMPINKANGG